MSQDADPAALTRAWSSWVHALELIDGSPDECRAVVWAHNGHVGRGANPVAPNLGDLLAARYGRG